MASWKRRAVKPSLIDIKDHRVELINAVDNTYNTIGDVCFTTWLANRINGNTSIKVTIEILEGE